MERLFISDEGGSPQELMPGQGLGMQSGWSPDGRSIIFSLENLGFSAHPAIHALDVGSHRIPTLPDGEALFCPRTSPNGRFLSVADQRFTKAGTV